MQKLGYSEVEKLWYSISIDQNVARLQVAVDDEMAMRVFNRGAHRKEEAQPLFDAEIVLRGILCDPGPLDVLHDQVGSSIVCAASIEQSCDVRMLKTGQNLALATEATKNKVGVESRVHQLDCNIRFVLLVVARCQIDSAHSTVAQLANEAIGTNPPPLDFGSDCRVKLPNYPFDFGANESCRHAVALEQR